MNILGFSESGHHPNPNNRHPRKWRKNIRKSVDWRLSVGAQYVSDVKSERKPLVGPKIVSSGPYFRILQTESQKNIIHVTCRINDSAAPHKPRIRY
jgi:hypothetical protein